MGVSKRWTCAWALAALALAWCAAGAAGEEREERFNPNAVKFSDLFGAFNESYKQALYATSLGERQAASELTGARVSWQMVLGSYYETPPEEYRKDEGWRRDLATITGYLQIADMQVEAGRLAEAHETLEPIRRVWVEINGRNGVRRFGDELVKFHEVMEPTVVMALAGVGEENIGEFEERVGELSEGWRGVEEFGFAPSSAERRARYEGMAVNVRTAVGNLARATEERDYAKLGPLAKAVKGAFAELYLAFG